MWSSRDKELLKVKVHPADLHDKVGGMLLLTYLHLLFPLINLPSIGFHRKIRQKSLENTIYGVCAAERPNIVLKCLCIQLGSCHVAHTAYMGIFPA